MIELFEAEKKFEELYIVGLESSYTQTLEQHYIEKSNVDVKESSKKLYIASQHYKTIEFLDYEELLHKVFPIIRDERIFKNFFNMPFRTQEEVINASLNFFTADVYWSFMIVLKSINYPSLISLTLDFSNLDQVLEKINEVRNDKIEAESVDSRFRDSALACSNRYGENFGGVFVVPGACLKYFFFLAVAFGFDLVNDIFDRLVSEENLPTFTNLFNLAEKWDIVKDYPLDWALAIAGSK